MRAFTLVSVGCILLAGCAPVADPGGTGPSSTASLVDFTATSITIGGIDFQESVSVLVRDARGTIIPNAPVSWTSDNPTIATVSGTGLSATVTAHAPGVATVRANAVTASSQIQVRVLAVRSVVVSSAAISLRANDTQTLTATVTADQGAPRTVRWSIENPLVATVSAQGVVTGVSVGTTVLRAAATADLNISAAVAVTVTPGRAVVLSPAMLQLWVGDADSLSAAPEVSVAQSRDVIYASDDPTIATVNLRGVVTAVAIGTTIVRATSVADARIRGEAQVRVLPARTVSVTPATSTVSISGLRTLSAAVTIEDGLSTAVRWRSDNPTIASVSQAGVVTGVSLGTVSITAVSLADTIRKGSATVSVIPVIRGITVSPTAVSIFPIEQASISADVDAEASLPRTVTWRSGNATVAVVSASGTITGVAAGQTLVTAISTADTTKRANVAVTVRTAPIIAVFPSQLTFSTGEQRTLTASVNFEGSGSTAVTWRSSNSAVVSVSQAGVITAVALGTVTITAVSVADTTRSAGSTVTVAAVVRSIALTSPSASVFIGQGLQLSATVVADAGVSPQVLWRTGNAAVATVSASGLVTGVAAGQVTITALSAADTAKRATVSIGVASRPVAIVIMQTQLTLGLGQSAGLTAQVTGDPNISLGVTWSSANLSVATVSANGLVTAVGQGTTVITATAQADMSRRATLSVVVSARLATSWTASRAGGALYEDVISIVSFDANAAYAVNVIGDVYRWDGSAWSVSARGSSFGTQFIAVHGTSASNLIAVGTNGVVVRFSGSTWSPMTSGTSRTLLDVFVESAGSAFASGTNGTVIRLSGSSWTSMTTNSTQSLNGIWSSGGNAVTVGGGGEVLRMVSGAWVRQSVPTTETLYGVSGTTSTNIVAVGAMGTIVRFNGATWTRVNSNGVVADFYDVGGTSANGGRMYIASDAGVLQLDGAALTAAVTPYQPRMFAVSVDPTGSAWTSGQRGSVFRESGGSFTTTSLAPDFLDVWSTSESNAWAVGEFGFIYRFNGSGWTRQSTPTTATLFAVWAANANDAFAGGDNGTMLHWDGAAWTSMALPNPSTVYALWGSSGRNVYAATADGRIFRYDGSTWTTALTTSGALWALFGNSPTDVYASGEGGRVMRFDGNGWSPMSPASNGTLAGLWASGPNNILTVGSDGAGANGVALRFDGNTWLTQAVGTTLVLTSAWGPNSSDVYATGDQGTILRFNGSAWHPMTSGTTDFLWSVTGAPNGVGGAFAVGYNGTIVSGGSGSSLMAGMVRANARTNLDPSPQARRDPRGIGPLPDGSARRSRRQGASNAALRLTPASSRYVKFGSKSK